MAKPTKEVRISPDPVSPESCSSRARRESPGAALRNKSASSAGRRTAMGEYVPPPGGRPLSSQALSKPSPADYGGVAAATQHTLPRSPHYSIQSRPYPLTTPPTPGPFEYTTSKDTVWSSNTITFKKKGTTWPYDTRSLPRSFFLAAMAARTTVGRPEYESVPLLHAENAHLTCTPGSGHYQLIDGNTGAGVEQSTSSRHMEGVNAGYPNPLVQPVDTHGFKTPGSCYRPGSVRGPEYSMGNTLKKSSGETIGPGPAAYTLPTPCSPTALCGEQLLIPEGSDYPAPNHYDVPGSVGTGQAKTFGTKTQPKRSAVVAPEPATYHIRKPKSSALHSLTYRPFPTEPAKRPGPAEYAPGKSPLPHCPEYSCRKPCLPGFPEVLLYPEHATLDGPGAGAYEYDREFKDNSKPAYSIALPLPLKPGGNPAPNHYHVSYDASFHTAPSYSMRQQLPPSSERPGCGPGPAAYRPRPHSASAVSITPRRSSGKVSSNPAPNNYVLERGQTNRGRFTGAGTSLKGRHTPLRYSGFSSSYITKLASLSL